MYSIGGDPATARTGRRGSRGIIYGDSKVLEAEVRRVGNLEGDEAGGVRAVVTAFYIEVGAADGRSAGLRGLSPACRRIKAPFNRDIAGCYSSDGIVEDIGARGHLDDGIGAGGAIQGFYEVGRVGLGARSRTGARRRNINHITGIGIGRWSRGDLEVDDIAKTPSRRLVTYLVGAGAEVHGIGRINPARAAIILPLTASDISTACNDSSTTTDDGGIRRDGDDGIGVDGNRISSRPGTAAISDIDGVSSGATGGDGDGGSISARIPADGSACGNAARGISRERSGATCTNRRRARNGNRG